jgi:hypothetical protein
MIDKLKSFWARLTVHWHVLLAALIAALPSFLDWLGVVDLKPILTQLGTSEDAAKLIVNLLPFVLAFVRPLIAVEPKAAE